MKQPVCVYVCVCEEMPMPTMIGPTQALQEEGAAISESK